MRCPMHGFAQHMSVVLFNTHSPQHCVPHNTTTSHNQSQLRLRVVGPCTKEALTHGLAALGTLLHLQHMEVNATQWTRTPKHTTTTTAMQATAHARNAAYTQGTVPAHAHALANAPSQSSSHISLYRAVSDDSDDDTQASCRAFFNSNEEEEGNYTGVYDTQEDDVSVRELSSTSVLLPLPGATITSNHRNHHHHTRAMHQDAQTEQHQQDGARDDRPVWVGPLVTGGGGASMVPSAAAAYPEKMLPKGLTTLVLHIGRGLLLLGLTYVSTSHFIANPANTLPQHNLPHTFSTHILPTHFPPPHRPIHAFASIPAFCIHPAHAQHTQHHAPRVSSCHTRHTITAVCLCDVHYVMCMCATCHTYTLYICVVCISVIGTL